MSDKSLVNAHDDIDRNVSENPTFQSILDVRLTRRNVLKGGFGLAASSFMAGGLAGCLSSGGSGSSTAAGTSGTAAATSTPSTATAFSLGFAAVPKNLNDVLTLPSGYSHTVLYALGDPINNTLAAYKNDGTDGTYDNRAGDQHDGMHYFGLNAAGTARDASNSARGLLVMNHENIVQIFLHSAAEVTAGLGAASRVPAQIDKEVSAHGVSVIEISRNSGLFQTNKASAFNRRVTAATAMDISGPAKGSELVKTKYSTDGTKTRGTLNNCANGHTPWGTYLTCEENWAGYFKRPTATDNPLRSAKEVTALSRYGVGSTNGSYGWANPTGGDTSGTDLYNRWNASVTGATNTADFRNVANTFGYVVEIDPYAPATTPRKRTALGRMGHEGCMPGRVTVGKPLVFYTGDDARNEYFYKYVSNQNWDAADATGGLAAGDKYLDNGKLYVAKFNADGSGQWVELNIANAAIAGYGAYAFADQADVAVHTRLAADAVGATKMDRPEWADVHPVTGDVYLTLTNNSNRGISGGTALDAANPRYYTDTKSGATQRGNVNGHIIRLREAGSDPTATTFTWDVYLFGAQAAVDGGGDNAYYQANVNISSLTNDNDFSSPDGLWFSQANPGLMWLQTDDGAYTDVTNCMLLAALPGAHGDGGTVNVLSKSVPLAGNVDVTTATRVGTKASTTNLRRFLVGPKGCEITGVAETPDGKALFINVQHPGEDTSAANIGTPTNYQSHWPDGGSARPRSATIVITKNDGGLIGS